MKTNYTAILVIGLLGVTLSCLSLVGATSPATMAPTTPTWIALHPLGVPPAARADATAVYIASGNQMIVFGGNPDGCTSTPSLNDTWVLTDANGVAGTPAWSQLSPAGSLPPARRGHSAVYNPTSDRMIVFGGDAQGCSTLKYDDVWVLNHTSGAGGRPAWVELPTAGTAPPERSEHVAAYDQARNTMIVYGGDGSDQNGLTDLWVLTHADGTGGTPHWIKLNPTGGGPSVTAFQAGTYDPKNNRLTVFGGAVCCSGPASNDVWVVTHANGLGGTPQWTKMAPSGTLPSPRAGASGRYTVAANASLYFAGGGTNELWLLTGANGTAASSWAKLTARGAPPAGRGGVVANPTAAYDANSGRSIFFGGKTAAGVMNDTWVLTSGTPTSGGTIYVLDTDNHRVQTFDSSGAYKSQFSSGFDLPTGVAMDTSSKIYVKDGNLNCQVDKFDSNGNFLLQFGACSPSGIGPGIFDNTGRVAADSSGNVWVTSPDYYYMQKFDSGGHFLAIVCMANVGVPGCPVATPFTAQPQGIASDANGNVYVTNAYPFTGGSNVAKFNSSGAYVSSFGSFGSGNGQLNDPEGIALDASGNIYVADTHNNRVQKFTSAGVYVSQFGSPGSGNGQFNAPVGIAFDSSGNIYVADVGNNRVQKFDSNGVYLSQFGTFGAGNGQFNAPFGVVVQ